MIFLWLSDEFCVSPAIASTVRCDTTILCRDSSWPWAGCWRASPWHQDPWLWFQLCCQHAQWLGKSPPRASVSMCVKRGDCSQNYGFKTRLKWPQIFFRVCLERCRVSPRILEIGFGVGNQPTNCCQSSSGLHGSNLRKDKFNIGLPWNSLQCGVASGWSCSEILERLLPGLKYHLSFTNCDLGHISQCPLLLFPQQ